MSSSPFLVLALSLDEVYILPEPLTTVLKPNRPPGLPSLSNANSIQSGSFSSFFFFFDFFFLGGSAAAGMTEPKAKRNRIENSTYRFIVLSPEFGTSVQ